MHIQHAQKRATAAPFIRYISSVPRKENYPSRHLAPRAATRIPQRPSARPPHRALPPSYTPLPARCSRVVLPAALTAICALLLLQRQQRGPGQQQQRQLEQEAEASSVPPRSMQQQAQLVEHLKRRIYLSPQVERALKAVDRRFFVTPRNEADAYEDAPLPIGYGQTISAPHMHAHCLEILSDRLHPGARALDVGSGSGYLTAALAKLVGPTGYVLGVELYPPLAERSISSIHAACPDLPLGSSVKIEAGNVLAKGGVLEGEAPFDAIHVGAAAEEIHEELVKLLKPGGRMVLPVGPHHTSWFGPPQVLTVVDKDEGGQVVRSALTEVSYVPLTRPPAGPAP